MQLYILKFVCKVEGMNIVHITRTSSSSRLRCFVIGASFMSYRLMSTSICSSSMFINILNFFWYVFLFKGFSNIVLKVKNKQLVIKSYLLEINVCIHVHVCTNRIMLQYNLFIAKTTIYNKLYKRKEVHLCKVMTTTTTIKDDDSRSCTCRCFLSINHTNYKIKYIKIEFTNKIS